MSKPFAFGGGSSSPRYKILHPECGACGLLKKCQSPKMPIYGDGGKGVLLVAEAPGEDEDRQNRPFVGRAGRRLRDVLLELGVDMDRDCWQTNALICRPPDNRTPTKKEIAYCRPNLLSAVTDLNPRVIVPLGAVAVRSLIGHLWHEDIGAITRWAGWSIPCQSYSQGVDFNTWVVPNYHPSFLLRTNENPEGPVVNLLFKKFLERAISLKGRPWDEIPNYAKQVEKVKSPDKAARIIRAMIDKGGSVAFDYETNRLKPDADDAEIVCCAVSWQGRKTIAYPWIGDAVQATKELLASDLPKRGANTKFEDRWTRAKLGIPVRNWEWDAMLSAHHLDNRRGISSVKFQAFVRLGQPPWESAIKPYLEAASPGGVNRIRQVDLDELLLYCGMDALIEYKLADLQIEEMNNG